MIDAKIPGLYLFSKNLNLQFSHCSQNLAELTEVDSINEIIGKTDFELCWSKEAQFYNSIDRKILKEKLLYANRVELLPLKNRTAEILISKYPLLNKNDDCIGISSHFVEITGYSLIPKKGYSDDATGRFYFDERSTHRYFTFREVSILKLLMIGYRPKKIACLLKISKRTVDEHIDNIKLKLNCHTTSEIVPAAFMIGLHSLTFKPNKEHG